MWYADAIPVSFLLACSACIEILSCSHAHIIIIYTHMCMNSAPCVYRANHTRVMDSEAYTLCAMLAPLTHA